MRVIRLHKLNDLLRFECNGCKSLLEMSEEEMVDERDAYSFVCCCCNEKNWVDVKLVRKEGDYDDV